MPEHSPLRQPRLPAATASVHYPATCWGGGLYLDRLERWEFTTPFQAQCPARRGL